ncbi:MAG: MmcQ/YjbR family DNA-binding protein [Alistipes sp.]|nr:MmcQ/YjbR family DNA-binding protein [Alistipes sp.]
MDILAFREYVLSLPNVEETTPFDDVTLVYKVGGRMFSCADMEEFTRVVIHHDADRGVELRDRYESITPAFHFNKTYWSSIDSESDIPFATVCELLRESYLYTIRRNVTPKALRERLLREAEE